jgi:uncharacterized damage-inducible protein DinB
MFFDLEFTRDMPGHARRAARMSGVRTIRARISGDGTDLRADQVRSSEGKAHGKDQGTRMDAHSGREDRMTPGEVLINAFSKIPTIIAAAVDGLDSWQLATRPVPGANTIAWLAWHTARGQDAWVSDLDGLEQVWTSDGWYARFGLPFGPSEMGWGMDPDDVTGVVATADLLTGYLDAVSSRTRAYIQGLSELELDEAVDAGRTPPATRGGQLVSIANDGVQHAGQAAYARGILDER